MSCGPDPTPDGLDRVVDRVGALTVDGMFTTNAAIVRHHVHADVNGGNYTALATDDFIFAEDSGASGNSVVLPDVPTDSRTIVVHNKGSNPVSITTAGDDTIEGATTIQVQADGDAHCTYDASSTDWVVHGTGVRASGELRLLNGVTTQVTSATPGAYDLVTAWEEAAGSNAFALNITLAKASNKITTIFAGLYKASFNISFTGSVVTTFQLQLFVAGVASGTCTERTIGTGAGGDSGSAGFANRPLLVGAGVDVDMRVASDSASDNFIPIQMGFSLEKV